MLQRNAARNDFRQGLADIVVPIALAVKREQLAHELWQALRGDPAVLLVDDTWTSGGNAQSAALALRAAGAANVAVLVIGRHFDRAFRDCETYYQQAKSARFTWDSCCLELAARDDAR